MAKNRNPLVGLDDGETIESVANVLQFLASQRLEGEETAAVHDGRRLILETCEEALRAVR